MTKKSIIIAAVIIACISLLPAQVTPTKVLFLGNSYTFSNNMPTLFAELAASAGETVSVESNTPGGYRLDQHQTDAATLDLIALGGRDFVVLQEQSQIPTIEYWRENSMYPAARVLDSLILIDNDNTAFFMTWGREFGGQQTYGEYSSPDFVDFFHMQDSLSSAYTNIAAELDATLCPVGDAWAYALGIDPDLELWSADSSHPSLIGSYLAACVFYRVFFQSSPVGLPYYGGLDQATAELCQQAADMTVVSVADSLTAISALDIGYNCYPNPFSSTTVLSISLPWSLQAEISVYDILGRKVDTIFKGFLQDGIHSFNWNGRNAFGEEISSGIYFYRLNAADTVITGKIAYR